MKTRFKINCDLGEGAAAEATVFPLIDAASIACGGHYGTLETISNSLKIAQLLGKATGAHPSYPDKANFGRKTMNLSPRELEKSLLEQIDLFQQVAASLEVKMDHIKFHGALYNDASQNKTLADFLTDLLANNYADTMLYVPPQSQLLNSAVKNKLQVYIELFGDRAYTDDFQLLSRQQINSLLTTEREVMAHLKPLIEKGHLFSITGKKLPVQADTLCFHGDNPGLNEFLPNIRNLIGV